MSWLDRLRQIDPGQAAADVTSVSSAGTGGHACKDRDEGVSNFNQIDRCIQKDPCCTPTNSPHEYPGEPTDKTDKTAAPRCEQCGLEPAAELAAGRNGTVLVAMQPGPDGAPWWLCGRCYL